MRSVLTALLLVGATAQAQKKADPVGVKLLATQHPDKGYVDDGFALDPSAGRLALVRTDGSTWSELEVLDLAHAGASLGKFDLTPYTTRAVRVELLGPDRLFVVGRATDDDPATAFLFDLHGKKLASWGPATDVALTDDQKQVVSFTQSATKTGTHYDVAVFPAGPGAAVAKRAFDADGDGLIASIGLQVIYWRDGYAQIVGRKQGAYDKYKDQRMNDSEGIWDVAQNLLARDIVLTDVIGWTKLMKLRQGRNAALFATVTEDLSKVVLITPDDKQLPLALAETIDKYDPKSIEQEIGADGKLYFSITIDPYNATAVERKAADPELIDFYSVDATGKATRIARLPKDGRAFSWRAAAGRLAVLRRHKGFDRGGPDLEIYDLVAP